MNLILKADSYKGSHYKQYPPGTEGVTSYIESRGGRFRETVFFGLQMFILEYLSVAITQEDIDEAAEVYEAHGIPFNREGWEHILKFHDGYIPLRIEAVPEGTVVPTGNLLVRVVNTDSDCAWVTSYFETALLRAVWYPTTVATKSRECRKLIKHYLDKTSDSSEGLNFKLHDFGARGVSSGESAAIGGLAHLSVGWQGSDTLEAILAGREYYNEPMAAFSIPAAEHSTITSWGRDGEEDAYENMLDQFPDGLVAVVSDSYDLFNAIDNLWGGNLKDKIIERQGTLVIRPDSGDPQTIVLQTMEHLFKVFGYETNEKGYKILPDYVRVIQGDGVSLQTIEEILRTLEFRGISTDNLAFGMGGELLQIVNRDDQKFAMKASAILIDDETREVYKDPVTDPGKKSKRGILNLTKNAEGEFITVQTTDENDWEVETELVEYYNNGTLFCDQTLAEIRERAEV